MDEITRLASVVERACVASATTDGHVGRDQNVVPAAPVVSRLPALPLDDRLRSLAVSPLSPTEHIGTTLGSHLS